MKRRIKAVAVLFAFLLVCTVLTGCTDDPIVGTWEMTDAEAMGQQITVEQFMRESGLEAVPAFGFTDSNKVTAENMAGVKGSGEWSVKDGKYTISISGGTTLEATITDGVLKMKVSSVTLTFKKK